MEKRYFVVANRFGKLHIAVNEEFEAQPGEIILHRAATIDDAFNWKEDMETRVARALNNCQTCEH